MELKTFIRVQEEAIRV